MKKPIILALTLLTTTSALAERIKVKLTGDVRVYRQKQGRSDLEEMVTFRKGTKLLINDTVKRKDGMRVMRLLNTMNPEFQEHRFRYESALSIQKDFEEIQDGYKPGSKYFVETKSESKFRQIGNNRPTRRRDVVVEPVAPSRPIRREVERPVRREIERPVRNTYREREVIIEDTYRRGGDRYVEETSTYEYERCYNQPRARVRVIDSRQQRRGQGLAIGGAIGGILGQVIGGDAGDAISVIGAGVAIVGLVEIHGSQETIWEDRYSCERYFERETRRVRIRGQRCNTTRYYTQRWGETTEYFETNCSGRRFVSFDRHSGVW